MRTLTDALESLRKERDAIMEAITLLENISGTSSTRTGRGRPVRSGKRRMSAAGRARIAAAQRKRWAKVRAKKKSA